MEREYWRSWGLVLTSLWHEVAAATRGMERLRAPRLVVGVELGKALAQWRAERRTIEVSRRLLQDFDWDNIEGVIRHEIAHQLVDELFGLTDAPTHGEVFARACKLLAIPPDAQWRPMPAAAAPEPVVMRIRKLLALSESDNVNEAAAALAKARQLAAKHEVDTLTMLAGMEQPVSLRPLGHPYKRVPGWYWFVMSIVEECAFVHYVCRSIAVDGEIAKVMEVYGSAEHLELAAYVHDFLIRRGEALWSRRRHAGGLGSRMKGSYLKGLYAGVAERLGADSATAEVAQAALVAREDPRLEALFKRRNPRVRTLNRRVRARRDALHQGQADSEQLRIRRGLRGDEGTRYLEG